MHIHNYDEPMAKQKTEGHTPMRPIRIPDDEWEALGEAVGDRNRTQAIREFIRWKLRWPGNPQPARTAAQTGGPSSPKKSEEQEPQDG